MLRGLCYRLYACLKRNYDSVNKQAIRQKYGMDASVSLGSQVDINGLVEIGAHTSIEGPAIIYGGKESKVKIGEWCAIASNLVLRAATHDTEQPTGPHYRMVEADITIGDHVWIGANVFIKSGVTVGDGAIIGANSVVTKDVATNSVVAGIPAKLIRQRAPGG